MSAERLTSADTSDSSLSSATAPLGRAEWIAMGAVVVIGVVARFVTGSPLWLDEALSVNIARLPIGDISDALRRDGHPPLYYVALHGWMGIFGEGDGAVRALSGVFATAALPLAYIAGRRRGGPVAGAMVVLVSAVAPFAVRYGTETRMYALVSFLVLAAFLIADDLATQARAGEALSKRRWIGLALLTGAALLTHYWSIYLGAAAVVILAARWWRRGERTTAIRVGSALAAGAVLFLPWVPVFLYQAANTGTPWGSASRPTQAVVDLIASLGGERFAEAVLFGIGIAVVALIGLCLAASGSHRLLLDLRTAPGVRLEMALVGLTLAIGVGAGLVTASTFVGRYASVFTPFLFVAAGVGLARLDPPNLRRVAVAALVLLGMVGIGTNVTRDRTQGAEVAAAIAAGDGTDDLVVFCPDQLGPSTLRSLPATYDAVGLPSLERPDRIDWVDYEDRNRTADPTAITDALLERAEGRTIWLVTTFAYRTYEGFCESVQLGLSVARPGNALVVSVRPDVYEPANVFRFDP